MPLYVLCRLTLLLIVVYKCYSHLNHQQNYLVCRPLDSLFVSQLSIPSNQSTIRGPPGRPGKQGPQGLKGATGPEPMVNWTRIDHRIEEIINEKRICSGVVYRGHCYWLPSIVETASNGGKSAAASVCSSYGATLVDIETSEIYDVLFKYIQKVWIMYVDQPTFDYVDVWLASMHQNGNTVSSSGGNVYTQWYQSHPSSDTGIGWTVSTKSKRVPLDIGMFTTRETYGRPVPLCRL